MLAQSAFRGGFRSTVIDQFADSDTSALSDRAYRLDFNRLKDRGNEWYSILNKITADKKRFGLIYGSGIDHQFDIIEQLYSKFSVYGNSVDTLKKCYQPKQWFYILNQLDIPFPETRFSVPDNASSWLIKESRSEGGTGISELNNSQNLRESEYFQKYLPGQAISALFLTDGERIHIIGFNTQASVNQILDQPFLFNGMINRAVLSDCQNAKIKGWIRCLVEALRLKGLNSLDLIMNDDGCHVIELNPRPSASVGLYDDDYDTGLVAAHIHACDGKLVFKPSNSTKVRAMRIIFAPLSVTIPDAMQWPNWCVDQPFPGTKFLSGQPLCSIIASGSNQEFVENLIKERQSLLIEYFQNIAQQ